MPAIEIGQQTRAGIQDSKEYGGKHAGVTMGFHDVVVGN